MSQFTAEEVMQEIDRQAPVFGIPPKLAKAFFAAENTADGVIDPKRVISGATTSPAGARGVMQTMPGTEELLKKAGFLPNEWQYNPADLRGQVQAGLAALKEKRARQKNPNDVLELATMYNAGTAAHRAYLQGNTTAIPAETQGYWGKITAALGLKNPMNTPQSSQPTQQSSSTRVSSSNTSQGLDPNAMAAVMQQGMQLIRAGGSIDTALSDISRMQQERMAAEQRLGQAITQTAVTEGAATAANTAVEANAAARRTRILNDGSINPDVANNLATAAMTQIAEDTVTLDALGSEIDQRMAVGIFDNPLAWLVNQTRLPGMVGQYNAVAEAQNRKIQAAKDAQALAATQISLSQGIDADLITRSGTAKAAADASKAQAKLAEVQANAAGAAIRDAQVVLATTNDKFAVATTIAQLTDRLRKERAELSDKEREAEAEKIALEQVNKYLKMIGSSTQYDTASFKMIPTAKRNELFALSGSGKIGNDLVSSVGIMNALGGNLDRIAAEGDAAATVWLKGTLNVANTNAGPAVKAARAMNPGKAVDEEPFRQQELQKLQQLYAVETADMRTASPYNPMKVDAVTLAKDPGLANNSLAIFINQHGPGAKDPSFTEMDERYIMARYVAAIASGKVAAPEAAKNISEFYKRGTKFQIEKTKYPLFGITPPSNGYTVAIPESSMFDRNVTIPATVDLTNPAAVEEYLTRATAARIRAANTVPVRGIILPQNTVAP